MAELRVGGLWAKIIIVELPALPWPPSNLIHHGLLGLLLRHGSPTYLEVLLYSILFLPCTSPGAYYSSGRAFREGKYCHKISIFLPHLITALTWLLIMHTCSP